MTKLICAPAIALALASCAGQPQSETLTPTRLEADAPAGELGSPASAELAGWRGRIDAVDREMVALLNRRAEYVLRLAPLKRQIGMDVRDPQREAIVRQGLREANSGPLPDESIERIYEAIMAAMRNLQSED